MAIAGGAGRASTAASVSRVFVAPPTRRGSILLPLVCSSVATLSVLSHVFPLPFLGQRRHLLGCGFGVAVHDEEARRAPRGDSHADMTSGCGASSLPQASIQGVVCAITCGGARYKTRHATFFRNQVKFPSLSIYTPQDRLYWLFFLFPKKQRHATAQHIALATVSGGVCDDALRGPAVAAAR